MTASENKIEMIRDAMPATRNQVYLNAGTAGPLASVTTNAIAEATAHAAAIGRGSSQYKIVWLEATEKLRFHYAKLTNAPLSTIALTHHTTDGMNIAIHGLNWQAGDELITTNWEHQGGYIPAYVTGRRRQVGIRVVELDYWNDMETIIGKMEAAITSRTRLLVISHVTWNTGLRLDLKAICTMAHKHGVLVVADAAQSAGTIPLDLPDSGVDFYAMPAQKWLCGPEGIGALYVRPDRLSQLEMTFSGFLSLMNPASFDLTGHYLPAPDSRRYEIGTVNKIMFRAMAANFEWLDQEVGWDYIYNRIEKLTAYAYEQLSTLENVTFFTQKDAGSGLITFNLDGYDPARVTVKLNQEGIVLRFLGLPYALRISVGFYNTEADIDTLIVELKKIQAMQSDELPEYVSPFDR